MRYLPIWWILFSLPLALLGIRSSSWAQAPHGDVEVTHGIDRTRVGGKIEERWNTREGFTLNLSQELSSLLSYNLLLNGTRTQDSEGRQTSEFTPQLSSNGNNRYYRSNWSYLQNEQRDPQGTRLLSTISSANFVPKLPPLFPSLTLSRSASQDRDDLSPHQVDTTRQSWQLRTDYAPSWIRGLRLAYDYNWSQSQDLITDDQRSGQRHQGRISFGKTLWERLSFSSSWGREVNLSSSSRPFLPTVSLFVAQGLSALHPIPTLGTLDGNPRLTDGDLFSPAGPDLKTLDNNLGMDLGREQTVESLFIYTLQDFSDLPRQPRVIWEIYRSNDGIQWERVTSRPITTFNLAARRYELSFPVIRARYLKVVNRTSADFPGEVGVTEVEAVSLIPGGKETDQGRSDRTNASLGAGLNLPLTQTLALNLSTTYNRQESNPSDRLNENRAFSGGLSFTPNSYLMLRLGASHMENENRSFQQKASETNTTSYYASLDSKPLATLWSNLSLSLSQTEKDGQRTNENLSTALNVRGNLYRGIETGMNYAWTHSKSLDTDSQSTGQSLLWELSLLPNDWLAWEGSYSLSWNQQAGREGKKSSLSKSFTMELLMNLSPVLQFSGRLEGSGSGSGKNFYFYRAEVSWRLAERLSLSATYASNQTGDRQDDLNAILLWKVNRSIDFNTSYSYNQRSASGDFSQSLIFHFLARF
ncbi:MAG: hypothetical protein HYY20_08895 [Candidatus Tectomicrobia bacterium]|uniref:F5/8 type C domain-containing protein n=1 Tax=Tectimicrobiota bacterium TaxID=2528274 RepID=A0A932CPN1_UNCTE|nr:hypothetical protein [Candidatus Tectomicrobia bacterium]